MEPCILDLRSSEAGEQHSGFLGAGLFGLESMGSGLWVAVFAIDLKSSQSATLNPWRIWLKNFWVAKVLISKTNIRALIIRIGFGGYTIFIIRTPPPPPK